MDLMSDIVYIIKEENKDAVEFDDLEEANKAFSDNKSDIPRELLMFTPLNNGQIAMWRLISYLA